MSSRSTFKMYMPIMVNRILDSSNMDVRIGHKYNTRCIITHKQFKHIADRLGYIKHEARYRSRIDGRIIGKFEEQIADKIHAYLIHDVKLI